MKYVILSLLVLTLLFVTACGSSDPGTGSIKITNPIKTCKNVDVPYEAVETYVEQEPYQATEEYQVDLKFEVVEATRSTTLHGLDVWAQGQVKVRNVDSETGQFRVSQDFKTLNREAKTLESTQYIMPGETKTFTAEYDIDMGEDYNMKYLVFPPQKTLTREVTKYRDVTKTRTVTKYRQEEVCE